jgi:glycosyltransferase involved in cell wall biosynthesis
MRSMKCVILAGGLGTRISEETSSRPKPMVEIGGKPILWHVMKIYAAHGIRDFIICAGYKGYVIKEYFANYFLHMSDITFDMQNNMLYLIYKLLFWYSLPIGTAPMVIGIFFFASVQLFFIGILGEYIGAIHTQVLKRPLVVEKERINF